MKWLKAASLGLVVILSGCASSPSSNVKWLYPPMATPLQPTVQQEVQIARLSQLLKRSDLNDQVRAKMHFERGNYYDSVGLRDLARLDYSHSLQLNPAQPEIFNQLGVYYTEAAEFDAAYEAFDSTLELDPTHSAAERNRAIALYYGSRWDLALDDIRKHYNDDPSDPFRALWLFIIQTEIDSEKALAELKAQYLERTEVWGWVLVGLMLEDITQEQALKAVIAGTQGNQLLAERLTEVYFYLGKRFQLNGDVTNATSLYKLALSFNVYEYIEHRYALLELGNIYDQVLQEREEQARLQR